MLFFSLLVHFSKNICSEAGISVCQVLTWGGGGGVCSCLRKNPLCFGSLQWGVAIHSLNCAAEAALPSTAEWNLDLNTSVGIGSVFTCCWGLRITQQPAYSQHILYQLLALGAAAPDDNLSATIDRSKQSSIIILALEDLHSLKHWCCPTFTPFVSKTGTGCTTRADEDERNKLEWLVAAAYASFFLLSNLEAMRPWYLISHLSGLHL